MATNGRRCGPVARHCKAKSKCAGRTARQRGRPRDGRKRLLLSVSASAERTAFFITGPGSCFIFHSQSQRVVLVYALVGLRVDVGALATLISRNTFGRCTSTGSLTVCTCTHSETETRCWHLSLACTRQNPYPTDHPNSAPGCCVADVGLLPWLNHRTYHRPPAATNIMSIAFSIHPPSYLYCYRQQSLCTLLPPCPGA
jgi:hypothetical protein